MKAFTIPIYLPDMFCYTKCKEKRCEPVKKTIGIGYQDFKEIRMENIFYIDKTYFIQEWWEASDKVTLITRPRRFGKTLNMSILEKFFSVRYAGRKDLFQGLAIWKDGKQVITRMLTKSITRL